MILAYALKSTLILAGAALAAFLLRRRSAAARHLVWTAAAAALLALPLLSGMLPALRVPVAKSGPTAVFQVFVTSTPLDRAFRVGQAFGPAADLHVGSTRAVPYLPMLWMLGVALSLIQMLWAYLVLRRVRRAARLFPNSEAAVLARTLGIDHPVAILETSRGSMPMTCGIFRPAVLIPAGATEWGPERLRIVLLHELAHIRRGDLATHVLARLALSLYWWNPLAWFAWRAFVKERERATDDLVLTAGERASEYAGHLLEIARAFQPELATAAAALAMARRSELEGRLVAILDNGVNRRPAGRRAAVIAALAAVTLAAPFAAVQAQDTSQAGGVNFRVVSTSENPPEVDATIRAAVSQGNFEMLDRAAAAYKTRGNYDVARRLLEQALAIRGQVAGTTSTAYAVGLVNLGDLAMASGHPEQADGPYSQAVALGDRPEVARALYNLGHRARYAAHDDAAARDYFERVLKVVSQGTWAAGAISELASMAASQPGREAEAEALYQKAIDLEQSPYNRAAALNSYARFLKRQNRAEEAAQIDARANEVRGAATKAASADIVYPPGVYRVGNGVTAPQLIYKVEPQYTEEARAAKYQGTVLLFVEVQADGTAANIRVVRSLGLGLDEKAIEALRQWRFKPGTKDGVPVPVAATIEVNFRLL